MISPEILIRYPFFGGLNDTQIKAIAMIAKAENLASGVTIFQEGLPAESLYFLEEGSVTLYYMGIGTTLEKIQEGIAVGEINPGEPFSISAIIEPHILTSTARVTKPSRVIKIEAAALQTLMKNDQQLSLIMTHQAAKVVIERLHATRVQLAAAWA